MQDPAGWRRQSQATCSDRSPPMPAHQITGKMTRTMYQYWCLNVPVLVHELSFIFPISGLFSTFLGPIDSCWGPADGSALTVAAGANLPQVTFPVRLVPLVMATGLPGRSPDAAGPSLSGFRQFLVQSIWIFFRITCSRRMAPAAGRVAPGNLVDRCLRCRRPGCR